MLYNLIFTLGVVLFGSPPPFSAGACFEVPGAGVNSGPYQATRIIELPDGSYPPSDGTEPCQFTPRPFMQRRSAVAPGETWAVCTDPGPRAHVGLFFATVNVVPCGPGIFADDFESGGTLRWSSTSEEDPPGLLFGDGFESGDVSRWTAGEALRRTVAP